METKKNCLLLGLLAIAWLLFVMAAYATTHKPFDIALLSQAGATLWRFLLVVWILALSGGLGKRFFPFPDASLPALVQALLQLSLGIGGLGLITLLIGIALGVRWPLWMLALLLTVWLRLDLIRWLKTLVTGSKTALRAKGRLGKWSAILLALILCCTLPVALAPPTAFDTLTYHLTLPRAYLLAGRIRYIPELMFWGMPQTTEMLYTLAAGLGGEETATLLEWAIGLLVLLGLQQYMASRYGERAGWVAIATLLAGPSLVRALHSGYIEWTCMLYGLSFLVSMELWWSTSHRRYLLLAGAVAGIALGTKYTNGILALMGLFFISMRTVPTKTKARAVIGNVILFALMIGVFNLPWWLRNSIATGNPFYPLLFPTADMSRYRLEYYPSYPTPWGGWLEMLTLPWQATVMGVEHGVGPSASIGPLLLGLSPFALSKWRTREERGRIALGLATGMTVIGFMIWAVASRFGYLLTQTRLYIAFFPAWAVMGAVGFENIAAFHSRQIRFHRIVGAAVVLSLSLTALEIGRETVAKGTLDFLAGHIDRNAYLQRTLGDYPQAMQTVQNLPAGSSALMLWETRGLLCWPICDPDEVIDRWYDDLHQYRTAERILQSWQSRGYTHLLINRKGMEFVYQDDERLTEPDWQVLNQVLAELSFVQSIGSYALYQLPPP